MQVSVYLQLMPFILNWHNAYISGTVYVPDAEPTAKMIKKTKFEYLEPILSYFSCQ